MLGYKASAMSKYNLCTHGSQFGRLCQETMGFKYGVWRSKTCQRLNPTLIATNFPVSLFFPTKTCQRGLSFQAQGHCPDMLAPSLMHEHSSNLAEGSLSDFFLDIILFGGGTLMPSCPIVLLLKVPLKVAPATAANATPHNPCVAARPPAVLCLQDTRHAWSLPADPLRYPNQTINGTPKKRNQTNKRRFAVQLMSGAS